MNTLIIEPNSQVQYQQFVNLAKKLNVTFREEKAKAKKVKKSKENASFSEAERLKKKIKEDAFFALAGSLVEEDANQMIKDIEESRTTKDMDILWAD